MRAFTDTLTKLRRRAAIRGEAGSMLVEVVVSGVVLVVASVGVFSAFDAATRSTAEERHRSRAHGIAQADLSRMRTMRISDLANLNQTWTVTQDGQTYTVRSTADYQTDSTGTASCEDGIAAADYIKVSSRVTWPSIGTRPAVVATTLVAPPNGSVLPSTGSLAIGFQDAQGAGVAGVGVTGSGGNGGGGFGTLNGTTGDGGCAIFGNLDDGDWTLNLSGIASGLVDRDGNPPEPAATSVVSESTNTVVFQYDTPGQIGVTFRTKSYANAYVASASDSIVAYNTGLTSARTYGTPPTRLATQTATSLFPFPSPYSLYAGTCEGDNPNPAELDPPPAPGAIASVLLAPGGSETSEITLPALHATVYQGSNTSSARAAGATLKIRDTLCSDLLRTFTANSVGQLADPGLPFSEYSICAQGVVSGLGTRRRTATVSLNEPSDLTGGTISNLFLQGTGSASGPCP